MASAASPRIPTETVKNAVEALLKWRDSNSESKSKPTKQEAQKKIKADNVAVSKVLRLSKLASDYRPLRRSAVGEEILKKKKVPVQVDLTKKNWKEQVDKACSSALLFLGTGTCCVVKVAKVSMESEQIVENMMAAIEGVVEVVPKKWANVRSLHVKLYESLALPVFQAVPEVKLRIEEAVKKKKKGRIHEVRYMDSEVGEDNVEDVAGSEDDGGGVVMEEDLKDAGKVMKENSIKKSQNSELSVEDGDSGKKGKNIKKKLSQLQSEEADLKKKVRAKKSKKAA
ncbi:Ribosomal L1 domain-containing protein [Arachis hypogaea]|nr:Ribosomal L1 domain-containing protein [Arachis hypogaea]